MSRVLPSVVVAKNFVIMCNSEWNTTKRRETGRLNLALCCKSDYTKFGYESRTLVSSRAGFRLTLALGSSSDTISVSAALLHGMPAGWMICVAAG